MVAGFDVWVLLPSLALPSVSHVLAVFFAVGPIWLSVAVVVPVVVPAVIVVPAVSVGLLAVVVVVVVHDGLPLHSIRSEREWRFWLLARCIEPEVLVDVVVVVGVVVVVVLVVVVVIGV